MKERKPKRGPPPAVLIEWCPYAGVLGHFTDSTLPVLCSYDPDERFNHQATLYVRADLPVRKRALHSGGRAKEGSRGISHRKLKRLK